MIKILRLVLCLSFLVQSCLFAEQVQDYNKVAEREVKSISKGHKSCLELSKKEFKKIIINNLKIEKKAAYKKWKEIIRLCDLNIKIFEGIDNKKFYNCFCNELRTSENPHIIRYLIWKGDSYRLVGKKKEALKTFQKAKTYIPKECFSSHIMESKQGYKFEFKYIEEQINYLIFVLKHPKVAKKAEKQFMSNFSTSEDRYELLKDNLSLYRQRYFRLLIETENRWTVVYLYRIAASFYRPGTGFWGRGTFGYEPRQYRQDIDKSSKEIISFKNWQEDSNLYDKNLLKYDHQELLRLKKKDRQKEKKSKSIENKEKKN